MPQPIIEIRHLSKKFNLDTRNYGFKSIVLHLPEYIHNCMNRKTFTALDDISLDILPGDRVGLVGHNGCGKTTLLSIIGGVYSRYSGSCSVRGRVSMMLALGAGFCLDLSGRENIILNGVLQGQTRQEMMDLMDDIIDFAEIGDFIDSPVYQYSSGMQARLAFGIATAIKPEILLVDEVMAVGDQEFAKKCEVRINKVLSEGCTLILVSHNPHDIEKYCNRIVQLDHGRIVRDEYIK